ISRQAPIPSAVDSAGRTTGGASRGSGAVRSRYRNGHVILIRSGFGRGSGLVGCSGCVGGWFVGGGGRSGTGDEDVVAVPLGDRGRDTRAFLIRRTVRPVGHDLVLVVTGRGVVGRRSLGRGVVPVFGGPGIGAGGGGEENVVERDQEVGGVLDGGLIAGIDGFEQPIEDSEFGQQLGTGDDVLIGAGTGVEVLLEERRQGRRVDQCGGRSQIDG